ncbi:MAG: VPLPA-CTERM sorting domain-containing protein [Pikeienuella sp.]
MIRRILMSAVVFSAATFGSAHAATMYVSDSDGGIGTIDTVTGLATYIGVTGTVLTDIAFDTTGNLFGVDFTSFYSVDTTTGRATRIGDHGVTGANALVFGDDGTLYAAGQARLFTIDTATGAGNYLGNSGFSSGGDLAFSTAGDLYLASSYNQLVKLDLNDLWNGSSVVGDLGVSNMYGLATGPDGAMYGVAGDMIYTIDLATGVASNGVRSSVPGITAYGQAFYTEAGAPPVNAVPLPASGLLLVGGLATIGALRRRRA